MKRWLKYSLRSWLYSGIFFVPLAFHWYVSNPWQDYFSLIEFSVISGIFWIMLGFVLAIVIAISTVILYRIRPEE